MEEKLHNLSTIIEALNIFLKYGDPQYPFHCEHDELSVLINPEKVSEEDKNRLEKLGFKVSEDDRECFYSYRFGAG